MDQLDPGAAALARRETSPPGRFRLHDPSGALYLSLGDPPPGPGSGRVLSLAVRPGVRLNMAVFNFAQALEFTFEIDDQDLHFSFCTAGLSSTEVQLARRRLCGLAQAPTNLTVSCLGQARGVWRPREGVCRLMTLSVSREGFEAIRRECHLHCPLPGRDGRRGPFFVCAPASPAIKVAARGLEQALLGRPAVDLLLQCKTLELLILSIMQLCGRPPDEEREPIPLSRRDVDNLHHARDILLADLADPPSLPQLARRSGVNEFKLKRGFRQLFGVTPYACLRDARLERARRLLEADGASVCEACLAVGYSNQGHFIGLFKQRFGLTPGDLRQCAARSQVRG